MMPSLATRPPSSAAKPPSDTLMRPALVTVADEPLPVNLYLPARKSSFLMSSVEAANEPTLTVPVGVIAMPFGLTSSTVPGAVIAPAMVEDVVPVTRFSVAADAPG